MPSPKRTKTDVQEQVGLGDEIRPGTPAEPIAPVTQQPTWTFLSNHAHVLLLIAQNPEIRLRDLSVRVGITERAVQRIVADLEEAHYLEHERKGRRNIYRVHPELPLRHPVEAHRDVGRLLSLILD